MKRSFQVETTTLESTVVLKTTSFQIFIQEERKEGSTYLHIDGYRNTKDVLILEINQRGFGENPNMVITQRLENKKGEKV